MATGQVAALRDEIKRHELVYDMLDGRKTGKRSREGRSEAGALKRGPRGAMIDWTAVFSTLPGELTLDSLLAHKTRARRPEHISGRWSGGGRRRAGSDAPAGACTRKPDSEETARDRRSRVGTRPFRRLFQRCASAHRRCPNQDRWPVGNDSLFNGRSVTLGYRFPRWPQATEGHTRWRQRQTAATWHSRRP